MSQNNTLDISWRAILKIIIIVSLFYLLFLIGNIITWVVFALVISILFNSIIDFLSKRKIPRTVVVLLVYFSVFGIAGFLIYSSIHLLIIELRQFVTYFDQHIYYINSLLGGLGIEALMIPQEFLNNINQNLTSMAGGILQALSAFFGGLGATFFIFLLALFFSLEKSILEKFFILFFPKKQETYVLDLWREVYKKVNAWFGLRVLACLFVGIMTYLSFLLLGISYPLAFGILAAVLNFIPFIGPLVITVIMFFVLIGVSFTQAILAIILFTLINQIENNILSPLLTKKLFGIPACLVLISFLIGVQVWGLLGAILVIPLAGILYEFLKEFLRKRREDQASEEQSKEEQTVVL